MEDKILGFQFEPVSTKPTHPSYNDGSDQDEQQKQPPEVFCKKGVLRNFAKLTVKHLCLSLFFNNFIKKETLAQVFSCDFWDISRNTFFTEYIWATASGTRNPA